MREKRGAYRVLVGKHKGNKQLGRPRSKWEDNLKWIYRNWVEDMDWISLAQNKDRGRLL